MIGIYWLVGLEKWIFINEIYVFIKLLIKSCFFFFFVWGYKDIYFMNYVVSFYYKIYKLEINLVIFIMFSFDC